MNYKTKYIFLLLITCTVFFPILGRGNISYCSETQNGNPSNISLNLTPQITLPIGESTEFYTYGASVSLHGEYRFPSRSIFNLNGELGYNIIPARTGIDLSLVSLGGGVGITYEVIPKIALKGTIIGGVYYGFVNDTRISASTFNPYLSANAGIYYAITPSISLGLGASYINFFGLHYNGFGISLGATYHIGADKKPKAEEKKFPPKLKPLEEKQVIESGVKLEISALEFYNIFPVLFKYYDDHPVGILFLKNRTDDPITGIKVSLFVKQYMDNLKECVAFDLQGGQQKEIELNALFNDKILEITEGTKVSVKIEVDYTIRDERYKSEKVETVRLYDRNAITWEDNRRAAAFVTAKDPAVLTFSKNIAGMLKEKGNRAINENLRIAMALHDALGLYGMSYLVDPKTPYSEYYKKSFAVDFLQFPRQTLKYKAGDCDDLSILYCALLESVGIETAFITIPGHIFTAFSLDLGPEEARNSFSRPDELIFRDGKVWIPVEVTRTKEGFLDAWEAGSREWRENIKNDQAVLYPVHKAWEMYEPVGLPGEGSEINIPPTDMLMDKYEEELTTFIDMEIFAEIAEIQREIERNGSRSKAVNKLGILYAKYGLFDRAEKEFNKILGRDNQYIPALVNVGNIYYLQKNPEKALTYYEKAYDNAPDNPQVLLCVARTHHELENYGLSKKTYTKLKTIDQALAMKFAYLGLRGEEAARAAELSNVTEVVIWVEE